MTATCFARDLPRLRKTESLLHRIRRNNLDAFDDDPFRRLTHLSAAVSAYLGRANILEHVVAFDQFAERRVLMVQASNRRQADKKLRAGRIRLRLPRHRDDAAL